MQRPPFTVALPVFALFLNFAVAATPASAQTRSELPKEKVEQIQTAISSFMSKMSVPAVSVAVVVDNQVRFEAGYGLADLENFVPAKALTVYRIASTTKPLTAVAAMQLVERGKLDLDAPVQTYVPAFPTKQYPLTTRHLLAHTGGIRNYKRGEGERTHRYESLTEALAIFKDDPLEFEPGTRYGYTTYGYTLLGAVIEGASGMKYADYMRQNVFEPAGMTYTRPDDVWAIIPNRARGYTPRVFAKFDGNWRNGRLMDSSYKTPGGGFVSTAGDMARFAIALQDGSLIQRETLRQMSEPQRTRDGKDTGYAYGWYAGPREGTEFEGTIWHGGVQSGFTSELWVVPDRRFAVVILTNLEGGAVLGLGPLANQIADIVLERAGRSADLPPSTAPAR